MHGSVPMLRSAALSTGMQVPVMNFTLA